MILTSLRRLGIFIVTVSLGIHLGLLAANLSSHSESWGVIVGATFGFSLGVVMGRAALPKP